MANVTINALSLRPGGGLQVVAGLLDRFGAGNNFTVLWADPRSYEMLKSIVSQRANITFVKPINSKSNVATFMWSMVCLRKFLNSGNADIVLNINHHFPVTNTKQVVYHLNLLRFERPGHSIFERGEIADRMRDWRAIHALGYSDLNVFESGYLLEKATRSQVEIFRPHVVYIGRDERTAPPCDQNKTKAMPHILALTSPQPHKDNSTLIKMLAKLHEFEPEVDWRMTVAGGVQEGAFDDLKSLARNLNICDRILWPGFCNHAELSRIAENSLCLVSTSQVESFSMVALEAMAWGIPPIVANTSSMPESIGDAGLLAVPGDATSFAENVLQLWRTPADRERLILAGKHRSESLTWQKAADQFEKLFANLMTE